MSDVDPLIKRELQWMALGTLENRDLAAYVKIFIFYIAILVSCKKRKCYQKTYC